MRARIALDAMGGDFGPEAAVGAACSLSLSTDIETILVGDEVHLQELLDRKPYDPVRVTVRHASSWVKPEEDPVRAMRRKKRNSLSLAASMVGEGEADALVTGGNRDACLLTLHKHFRRLRGVRLPALGFVFAHQPESHARHPLGLLLDGGATDRCNVAELTTFAAMGAAYAREVSSHARPRVGFLESAGTVVGPEADREALAGGLAQLANLEFIGSVAENDLRNGHADVVVCEGRVGRAAVHGLEGRAAESPAVVRDRERSIWYRRPWARSGSASLAVVDQSAYAGSPVLGFAQVCLHTHRQSPEPVVRNAVVQAARMVRGGMRDSIRQAVAAVV